MCVAFCLQRSLKCIKTAINADALVARAHSAYAARLSPSLRTVLTGSA